jgi:phosphoserine phosphatase RsbU/P
MTLTDLTPAQILVADDQPDILEAIRLLFKQEGNEVLTVTSPEAIFKAIETREFDLLVMDLNYSRDTTSGSEGINAVSRIRALDHALPIIAMTAWGNIELAVKALHEGVGDFILKPWDDAKFVEIARSQIQQGRAQRRAEAVGADSGLSTHEILEARDVQRGFLPKGIPRFPGFAISGAWRPARIIGGDYFDVFSVRRDEAALCIGDVAGKGLAGALLMSNLQAAVKAMAAEARHPQNLCARLNQLIRANVSPHKFITFFCGLLNAQRQSLTYTNAGHNPPILLRSDGSIVRLEVGGPVLGVFPGEPYGQTNVSLVPGNRLVLFTDGLIEATNDADEEFGEARLIDVLLDYRTLTAEALQERVLNAASQFCKGDFDDDATLVIVAAE